jgi:class 3 adenylate cyclase
MGEPDAGPRTTEAAWFSRIGAARNQGNHLAAFDLASRALREYPLQARFEHQAILALARAGALGNAVERYNRFIASGQLDGIADMELAAEFAGLGGRLFKDLATRAAPEAARAHRLKSATAYEAGFLRLGGHYLAINAATMYLAASHREKAEEYAHAAHFLACEGAVDYWKAATQAEAMLILGDRAAAEASLQIASSLADGNFDALASTRKQIAWLAGLLNIGDGVLAHLPGPLVLNWRSSATAPAELRLEIPASPGLLAFGPLLGRGDLDIAEALLEAGAKLHLVMPCAAAQLAAELCGSTAALRARFESVLNHADTAVMMVTAEGGATEPAAALLCQQQARGLALLRGQSLEVAPQRLRFSGARLTPVPLPAAQADLTDAAGYPADRLRAPHAILFGDVHGFSKLSEFQQLDFLEHIIGGFADVLDAMPAREYAETAGDGLFIVLSDIVAAVECCFALRSVLPAKAAAAGLPADLGMRISAHVGPLYKRLDRVIAREKFCGMEVIRTARIEPVTPVGEIFVTEQFAASLACVANDAFICEYAGLQPMAKGFGECRMYALRRRDIPASK